LTIVFGVVVGSSGFTGVSKSAVEIGQVLPDGQPVPQQHVVPELSQLAPQQQQEPSQSLAVPTVPPEHVIDGRSDVFTKTKPYRKMCTNE